jgi:hypothetical protein
MNINNIQKENTQTQSGVGVGSRFTLEDCRRYAEHLHKEGKGITNPGGYATTIYRTGEVDNLIDLFLHPAQPLDVSKCPDCQGMGFYYPKGFDQGVVHCKHERINAQY